MRLTHKEHDSCNAEPDEEINGQFFPPGYLHILSLSTTHIPNQEVRHIESECVDEE